MVDQQIDEHMTTFRMDRVFKRKPKIQADTYSGDGESIRRTICMETKVSGIDCTVIAVVAGVGEATTVSALTIAGDKEGYDISEQFIKSLRLPSD